MLLEQPLRFDAATTQLEILGVRMSCAPVSQVVDDVVEMARMRAGASVFFANCHTLNTAAEQPAFRDVLARADMVLNDGVGVRLASRLVGAGPFENQNGTDLVPALMRAAGDLGLRFYWLGGRPGRARLAGQALARLAPGAVFVGEHHGYLDPDDVGGVCEDIRRARPHIVLVSLGNPLQEQWVDAHLESLGGAVVLAVGGLVDHMSEHLRRAPAPIRRLGLEWVVRLAQQPWVWRRYVFGIPKFLVRNLRRPPRLVSMGEA